MLLRGSLRRVLFDERGEQSGVLLGVFPWQQSVF
jgi:hypothetical protein